MMNKSTDYLISYHAARRGGWLQRLVRRMTAWAWKYQMQAPIQRLFERGLISSHALHEANDFARRVTFGTPLPRTEESK